MWRLTEIGLGFFGILLAVFLVSSRARARLPVPAGVDTTIPGAADNKPWDDSGPDASGPGEVAGGLGDEDLARMKVNELGKIMVIMYHDIQDKEGEWVRSRANFRKDLQRFYDLGYSLTPLSGYLTGDIQVPAGKTPLVLTFDDGTRGQLTMVRDDTGTMVPDPDCAVGILLEFSREHPDFGQAATFFINSGNPFGDASRIKENLTFLLRSGMEIGNHTRTHANLTDASPDQVAKEIGSLANEIKDTCDCDLTSLALPYGGYPKSKENLLTGTWDGRDYVNKGVLLVGAEPAPSPFSSKFNPLAIPRIRGSQEELDKWLNQFQKYPEGRFVSDGDSRTVTVEEGKSADLDPAKVGTLTVRTYQSGTLPGMAKQP